MRNLENECNILILLKILIRNKRFILMEKK